MKIEEIMTKDPVTFKPDDFIADAVKVLEDESVNGAPVIDGDKFVGLITTEDILDYMKVHDFANGSMLPIPFDFIEYVVEMRAEIKEVEEEFEKLKKAKVGNIMNKKPVTAGPSMHVSEAADLMSGKKLTHLPVVENGRLLGLVTRSDLLKSLI